jgi:hypothetical protein
MSGHTGTTLSRRRGFALASAISMVTLVGFTSVMGAHANTDTVTITAEIALCNVTVMAGSEADLETGENTADHFVFTSGGTGDFIDVDWDIPDPSCAGQLWAKRGGIMKGDTPVADAELSLLANAGEVAVNILETYVSVSDTPGQDKFYAKMLIPRSSGAGTYTTTVDFTVDVSAPQ